MTEQEFKNILFWNPLAVLLLLMPSTLLASGYSNPIESFFKFLIYGLVASALIYLVIGVILALMGKLKQFMMVPVFLVLMAAAAMTMFEVAMIQIMGGFPGGILVGVLISTMGFIYLVKNSKNTEVDTTIE